MSRVISLLWHSVSQKLIMDMKHAFFMEGPTKMRLIEGKCKHVGILDTAVLLEMQLEPTAMA